MTAQTGADARRTGTWRLSSRRDRHRRQIGPVVEALERRLALAGTSPTNPVPIGPQPGATPNPHALGAAYQQVVVIQATTLRSVGDSYREVQAAGARFASRAAVAIDGLEAELGQSQGHQDAEAIAAAIRRDRHLLDLGGADVTREEQGLDVARGLADQQANTDETDITNGLFTTLAELVQQDQSTGAAITRTGQRSANALTQKLDKLGDQLTPIIPERTSERVNHLEAIVMIQQHPWVDE
jgi:hypothetical protein